MRVVGVDGCRGGWLAVALEAGVAKATVFAHFADLLSAYPDAAAIAVDMPIGLWESDRARMRPCDALARKRLGKRASCVFIPPSRAMLSASSYTPLREQGLSVQAYNLIPRIRELDTLLTPELQARVWESHPELSFAAMTGAPIAYPKRTEQGQAARREALKRALNLGTPDLDALWRSCRRVGAGYDDLLDACALAWSAIRHVQGHSELCIGEPERDERGLAMTIRF
jgi:predicted RNase H-like nuclease